MSNSFLTKINLGIKIRDFSRLFAIKFIELMARFLGLFPNTFLIEIVSALSLAGVPVPCALTYWTSSGLRFAFFKAFFMAETTPSPSGWGIVIWYASQLSP